jgi:hypothetical protein
MGGVYQEARPDPNTPDLRFPFDLALEAARSLWKLADRIDGFGAEGSTAAREALVQWRGPLRGDFEARRENFANSAATVAGNMRDTATEIAKQWSLARGQQNRINFARYVAARVEEDRRRDQGFQINDIWDNPLTERWKGARDYGSPPSNPDAPSGPGFMTGSCRVHPDYGP